MVETLTTLHNAHLWHGRANGVRRFLRSTHTDFAYNLHVRIAVPEHVSGFNLQITCRSIRLSHWLSLYYILFNGMWFVLAFQHQLTPSTEIIRVWVCFVRLNTFVILFHIHFHIPHTHTHNWNRVYGNTFGVSCRKNNGNENQNTILDSIPN